MKHADLNSGVLQNFLRQQDSIIKSQIAWCKKRHKLVHFPENVKVSIPLRNDMFHFEFNKETKSFQAWLKFLRIYFPLNLCSYHIEALKDMQSISDSSISLDQKNNLILRLCFKTKSKSLDYSKTLGVDLGIAKPIVCSDGKQFGSGKHIKHTKIEFGKKRARNSKKKEQISQKQSRWTDNLNHKLSRELVNHCLSQEIGVLSLENLKGSHLACKKFRKYNWAFKDLISKIKYKAECTGLKVVSVDPKYTSQTCNACGQKSGDNRKTQSLYECSSCGARVNADINAAKNIRDLSVSNDLHVNLGKGKALNPEALIVK